MKTKYLVVLMVVGLLLSACSRERASLTGAYGESMLSGQVAVSGTPNPNPEGVRVSVRGTGMSMLLGPAGTFAFAGVPENAALDFSRESDGIQASLQVEANTTYLDVELTPTTAAKGSGRRRGVGRGVESIYEFEGTVVSATDAQVVVFTSKKVEQTIALAAATIIRKGNATLTAADLLPGTRVHVKARKSEETYTAVLVIVQSAAGEEEEEDGEEETPAVRQYEGTVRSAAADSLVVFTSKKEEVTFVVNAQTVIRKGNTTVAAADIAVGTRVHVKASTSADGATKTATRITIQNTKP